MNRVGAHPHSLTQPETESPDEANPERLEGRQHVVHVVEYNRYPRRDPAEERRVAYTQDRSDTGLGLDLPEEVAPGELLRITLHDIDGGIDLDGLARVVWCRTTPSGRSRAGISILREQGERPLMRVGAKKPAERWKIFGPGSQ